MGYLEDYKPDYSENTGGGELKAGEYVATVQDAYTTESRNGNRMIKVELTIAKKKFFWCLVEGNWFNANCTRFFVCFGIQPGNFEFNTWVGKTGTVAIDRDESNTKFFRITELVPPNGKGAAHGGQGNSYRPPASGSQNRDSQNGRDERPKQNRDDEDRFDDDIPF
jgi:hypothetical protein